MSIIVWDGKTLAADKQTTNVNLKRPAPPKIFRRGDLMFAGVGQHQSVRALMEWASGGMLPATFPKDYMDSSGSTALWIINRNGTIGRLEDGPFVIIQDQPYFADGSGRDFAYGAMAMGADAVKAVEIACQYDIYCGGGIDTLTFDD